MSSESAAGETSAAASPLRGTIDAVFRGLVQDGEAPRHARDALRRHAVAALSVAELAPVGAGRRHAWHWPDTHDLRRVTWPLSHTAVDLLTSEEITRVKRCAACRWLFLDRSRNRSRRWCSMEECGTHEKVARYLERRSARRT